MASTKAAALPSMIGTSGPSISIDDVVDVEPAQRGQQMLGGRAERAGGVAEHGGKFGGGDGAHVGADFALDRAVGGDALEHDTGVVVGRMQGERDGTAGMNADAGDGNMVAQRCLLSALHSTRSRKPDSEPCGPHPSPNGATISAFNSSCGIAPHRATPRDRKVPFTAET